MNVTEIIAIISSLGTAIAAVIPHIIKFIDNKDKLKERLMQQKIDYLKNHEYTIIEELSGAFSKYSLCQSEENKALFIAALS